MRTIVVIGATSQIAQETARIWASEEQTGFYLIARDQQKLAIICDDLLSHGAKSVQSECLDVSNYNKYDLLVTRISSKLKKIDILLIAHGIQTPLVEVISSEEFARKEIEINFTSYVLALLAFSQFFKKQGFGCIAVISSVAADRGRQTNFPYASTKAALSAYVEGLRGYLKPFSIKVVNIKPGIVDTPLSRPYIKSEWLVASAAKVGADIVKAIKKEKEICYTPRYWVFIMWIIRNLPNKVFDRLKI